MDQRTLYRDSTHRKTPQISKILAEKHMSEATKERPGLALHKAGPWQRVARTLDAAIQKRQPQTYAK